METSCNPSKITLSYSELWHVPEAAVKGCAQWGMWHREEEEIFSGERRTGSEAKLSFLRGWVGMPGAGSRAVLGSLSCCWAGNPRFGMGTGGCELGFWELGSPQAPRQH